MEGIGVQVVQVEDHSYRLNVEELKKILLSEIKDLPVVVVSVAGAFRGGKSFLLNFFLKYLTAPLSSRVDGSWMGDDDDIVPLEGFHWRGGSKRDTTGIVMWSEPIISVLASGEKVAVLLMDSQGTFDSSSTIRDCSTIFALSTLLSSIQIYNLSGKIKEDDLQHLQLFTEYGKLIKDQNGKAFQALEFLIRDWPNAFEIPYGSSGGKSYLKEKLQTDPNQAQELRDLREHILDSFDSVSCFLLPHPGLEVTEVDFNGSNHDLSKKFKTHVKELATYLFGPGNLRPKKINGQVVKAREFFTYFEKYMAIFNSDEIPTPKSIMQATAEASVLAAFEDARRIYETGMDSDCGSAQPSVTTHDLKELHDKHVSNAILAFTNKKKMVPKRYAKKYLKKLEKEFENRLPQFVDMNIGKIQKIIKEAKEAYDTKMGQINGDQLLCVHPFDLDRIHRETLQEALEYFDGNRKVISDKEDVERDAFIEGFQKQYHLLYLTNEQNNKNFQTEMRLRYWNVMEVKCSSEPLLSESEFLEKHKKTLAHALDSFANKRNFPDLYDVDEHKADLIKIIHVYFDQMKTINKSKNSTALKSSVRAYDEYMASAWDPTEVCLRPEELEQEQEKGELIALSAFRPTAVSTGRIVFDTTDEDEKTLSEILHDRFNEIKRANESANETAVCVALKEYISQMDFNCGFSYWWLIVVPYLVNKARVEYYHSQSKKKAEQVFYTRRRAGDRTNPSTDSFFKKLHTS